MITGIYDLIADPSWAQSQFQELRLECDTTLGPVTINLPAISTLAQSTNFKLFIVDATELFIVDATAARGGLPDIIINAGQTLVEDAYISDTFNYGTTQLTLTRGSSVSIQNVSDTQWIALESLSDNPGPIPSSSTPFAAMFQAQVLTYNITDALEGTSIPDNLSDSYIKTIPLWGMPSGLNTALVVFNCYEVEPGPTFRITNGNGYGVTSGGNIATTPLNTPYTMVESVVRLLVRTDFGKTIRPQPLDNTNGLAQEVDEVDVILKSGNNLSYSEIGGCLIGVYSFNKKGIGYTSDAWSIIQDNTVIKSAYLDNSGITPNLVFLLKKRIATVGLSWLDLEFNVYNVSV